MDIAEYIKYATVYGMYGVLFLLVLISAIVNTGSFPESADNVIGIVAAIAYLAVAGIDTFV